MNILKRERAEINKLKAIEEKKKHQGFFAEVSPSNRLQAEMETGTTPTKSQFQDVVSNLKRRTPEGKPPKNYRSNHSNEETKVPGYASHTESSMSRLTTKDLV